MDSRPRNLLLLVTSLLHFSQCGRTQPSYIIDNVGLTVLPSSTVQSGTPVTLHCQVSVSLGNIPHLTYAFLLTRDDVPIHSTNTTEDSIEYELNPARAADSGSYECRVKVMDKSKTSVGQTLDVTGLQMPILLLNKKAPFASEKFTATCSAPDEKGSLVFRFYQRFRTGEPLKIKQLQSTGNSTETTLVLSQVGDSVLYCDYEIYLVSGMRRSNSSNEVQVLVKALYIAPVMNVLPSGDVFEGDIVEVICKVVNSPKDVEVFLIKDRRILKRARVSLSHRFKVQEGDSGELVCKAEWGSMQKETYQPITVKELFSKPRLNVEPTDIFEGDRFKLTCSVSIHYPESFDSKSMRFFIYKDNVNLTTSDTYMTVARSDKNGNYTCKVQATSPAHSFVKESPKLAVEAKVPVSKPMLSVVGGTLVLGKPFQLLCRSDRGTLPIVYTLYGPGKLNEHRVVSKPGNQAVFNSSAIFDSLDLNSFICHAKNSQNKPPEIGFGQQLRRSANIIEPVSEPALAIQPSTRGVPEGQAVTLVCSVQQGSPPISFRWYRNGKEGALHSNTTKKLEASYRIDKVKGEDGGEYYCGSTNPANETKHSNRVVIGVTMAGWKKGLIAVFCIILILVLMLVFTFKRCLRHFKRKGMGELSVKSAGTKVEQLSLTQAEVIEANATPGMMGKSIWSEHMSGSESDDQNSVTAAEPQYTEVQTREADPNRALVKKGTDTVYSEVRNSKQGVPVQADGQGSVEYTQLNHDTGHHGDDADHGDDGNQGDHSVQDDHVVENNNGTDIGEENTSVVIVQ